MASFIVRRPHVRQIEFAGQRFTIPNGWYTTSVVTQQSDGQWIPQGQHLELGFEKRFFVTGQSDPNEIYAKDYDRLVSDNPLLLDTEIRMRDYTSANK